MLESNSAGSVFRRNAHGGGEPLAHRAFVTRSNALERQPLDVVPLKVYLGVRRSNRHDALSERRALANQSRDPRVAVSTRIRLEIIQQKRVLIHHALGFALAIRTRVLVARHASSRRDVFQLRDDDPRRHVRQHRIHHLRRPSFRGRSGKRSRGDEHSFVFIQTVVRYDAAAAPLLTFLSHSTTARARVRVRASRGRRRDGERE